jgi:hypothetical protein
MSGCLFIFVQIILRALQAVWNWLNAYIAFGMEAIYKNAVARNAGREIGDFVSAAAAGAEEGVVPAVIGTISSIVTSVILVAFVVGLLAVTIAPLVQFNKLSADSNNAAGAARSKVLGAGGAYPGMLAPTPTPGAEAQQKQKELLDGSVGAGTVGGAGPLDDLPPSNDNDPNWEVELKKERDNFQAGQDFPALITRQKQIYKTKGVDPCRSALFPQSYCN